MLLYETLILVEYKLASCPDDLFLIKTKDKMFLVISAVIHEVIVEGLQCFCFRETGSKQGCERV